LKKFRKILFAFLAGAIIVARGAEKNFCPELAPYFHPPSEFTGFGKYPDLLSIETAKSFDSGKKPIRSKRDWQSHRKEIKATWEKFLGPWPPLLKNNHLRVLETTNRENFIQKRVEVTVANNLTNICWLLMPKGKGPFPAVVVPYYEPETSIGMSKQKLRDFGLQLARRGFVTLSIGSPGGDARAPDVAGAKCQPLSFLAYIASNCRTVLANLPEVDPKRIGIVGHSYGGKWAMFATCLDENFACGVFSDPGIVFDEARPNVNYWEPWYLGKDPHFTRKPGVITPENPRTGAYRELMASGHDLHELLALIAPRPFLVSGGSEDQLERWQPLNRVREVYDLLGAPNRVGMTNRPNHDPTEESNAQIYQFFECALKPEKVRP
jgi:dienelactone hydrolase